MGRLRTLDHIAVMVSDLERSRHFYADLLGLDVKVKVAHGGWAVETMADLPGAAIVEYRTYAPETPGITIDLIEYVSPKSPVGRHAVHHVPSSHICFGVDDLQGLYDRLVTEGVEFVSPPVHWPPDQGSWVVLFLRDPDGNLLELVDLSIGHDVPDGRWALEDDRTDLPGTDYGDPIVRGGSTERGRGRCRRCSEEDDSATSGGEATLRSDRWFKPDTLKAFGHRSRLKQLGLARDEFVGRPVIGILNTWSDITPCHQHFRQRADDVKRGVWSAGGFPLEIPAISLSEPFQKPTTMVYRNLLAIEAEELIRSYPIDGVVLMGGCDKTVPGLVMGALSAALPTIFLPAGPMLRGTWRGQVLGSGTDSWRYWAERRAGAIDRSSWDEIEGRIARSAGHCMTMGTASTMTAAVDALGLTLPGASSIPAVDADHPRMAASCGRRIVQLVREQIRPRDILTTASFENAATTVLALGGSTNAVIHLVAMASRAGCRLSLDRFDELSRATPVIADISPTGRFLMEDFAYAGGLLGLLARIPDLLALGSLTVAGSTLGDEIERAEVFDDEVIRPRDRPVAENRALVVLRGSLAPDGAVIKPHAGDPRLHRHQGPAIVFDDMGELTSRIDDPTLGITEDTVIVLRNAGPVGAGMPEWGMLPLPRALLEKGVRDMVRISDARMSGTSYGTCVLHVAPEAAIGGPLALVHTGDTIRLDVEAGTLDLLVDDRELDARRAAWKPPRSRYDRGYGRLFAEHVEQANTGCDFDFLRAGAPTPEPEIY